MSLTIGITNPRGVVLAADSRQTYINNANQNRIGSDTATKIIPLSPAIAVTIAGSVYFEAPTPERPYPKNITEHITEFGYTLSGKENVEEVAKKLHIFLCDRYKGNEKLKLAKQQLMQQIKQQQLQLVPGSMQTHEAGRIITAQVLTPNGQTQSLQASLGGIDLMVAGYDKLGSRNPEQHLFMLGIPGDVTHKRKHNHEGQYGAAWQGQQAVVTRIIKGFDPLLYGAPFMQVVTQNTTRQELEQQLTGLEYMIAWPTMTLIDAVEIAKLLIETSIAVQRFSSGPMAQPTDIQGVGGSVDIAVIDPLEGFGWLNSKELKVERPEFRQPLVVNTSPGKPTKGKL